MDKFIEQKISETLNNNYMPYAMSVIVSRAIPEIDGLKPSHRKLLYTMYKMGLLKGNKTKSANIVGQTMKLNPHGDMAIYETMVRLTTGNASLLHPLIESKGNMGKSYSREMKYAAPRYTEAKLDGFCNEIFKDIDKNTVDFIDNYDGTMKEPVLLPTTYPNILVNPNQGIAVGMASNICSFNLIEICNATIAYMENDEIQLKDYVKAPDFSTGGVLVYKEEEIDKIYKTGRGSFKVRGKHRYDKKNNCIEIIEIPYSTSTESIIDSIVALVKSGKIKDIVDVRDETDLKGLKITIDIKKSTDVDQLIHKLYRFTPLEDSFNCNFNMLIGNRPMVLGIKSIIKHWIEFRIGCIKRQIAYDISKKKDKLHLLQGLEKIILDIDKAIRIIRETEKENQVIINLMKGFSIDKIQAEYIAEIKLRNLNREYLLNRTKEIENLRKEIENLENTYKSNNKIKKLIINQLKDVIKKYGRDRNTTIIHEDDVFEITDEHLIAEYNLKLFFTEHGYLKKIPLTSLRNNPAQKLKDEDKIIQEIETHNKAEIIFFSTKHNAYKMRIHEIGDCKASSLGQYLGNLLNLDDDEEIIYIHATDNYQGMFFLGFDNGKAAKIPVTSYETKTNRKKLANAYSKKSKLLRMMYIEEELEMVVYDDTKKALLFNTKIINLKTSRSTQGIQIIRSAKMEKVTAYLTLEESGIKDPNYYKPKNIPAAGFDLKRTDSRIKQLSLFT